MNVMMTKLRCSQQGWLYDATTQDRPKGDHENMIKLWLLMTKINTEVDKYEGKVVPQLHATCEEIRFEEAEKWPFLEKWLPSEVSNYHKQKDTHYGERLPMVLMACQTEL